MFHVEQKEFLNACPSCGGVFNEVYLSCVDYTVSRETFNIVSCRQCYLKFTNPRPEKAAIGKYYDSPEYISHTNESKGLVNKLYQFVRRRAIKGKFKLIKRHVKFDSLLDIGCGTGEFLNYCSAKGLKVHGVEPDEKARSLAIRNYGLSISDEKYLQAELNERYSVVTMWHVLEHVHDLSGRLQEVKRLLDEKGVFVVAVPNAKSYDASHYGQYWAAYDVPRHLYHFTPATIKTLMEKNGFNIIARFKMPFDSFYVSMLSEKYKYGYINFLRAFSVGFTTWICSLFNKDRSSSMIYIIKPVMAENKSI